MGHTWNFRHCACVRACMHACVRAHTQTKFCVLNLSQGFGRINLKPFQINYIWVEVVHLLFLIGVCPSVCLWEASELRSGQHLTIPSDFFPMFCPELLRRFWSDQSETLQIEYIWVEVVHLPLGAMSVRPFVCEKCRNLGPHSILLIRVLLAQVTKSPRAIAIGRCLSFVRSFVRWLTFHINCIFSYSFHRIALKFYRRVL